ncbi:MAG: ABC transporter permease, partial [Hyphomicrobiaceae bacterium]
MTVAPTLAVPSPVVRTPLPRTMALAFRELRGGLRGFYVFTACVALGVTVIAGVGALGDALRAGFEKQGEAILGGDVTLTRSHRRADNAERAWLAGRGRLSETAAMRGMARPPDGSEQALMEIKGVDAAYPLAGEVVLRHGKSLDAALHAEKGAAVAPLLLEQLRLKVGDRLSVGQIEIPIAAVIESEPDTVTDRLTYGPRVLVSLDTLERTGLVQPGSLIRWRYALKLPPDANLGRFRVEVGA